MGTRHFSVSHFIFNKIRDRNILFYVICRNKNHLTTVSISYNRLVTNPYNIGHIISPLQPTYPNIPIVGNDYFICIYSIGIFIQYRREIPLNISFNLVVPTKNCFTTTKTRIDNIEPRKARTEIKQILKKPIYYN